MKTQKRGTHPGRPALLYKRPAVGYDLYDKSDRLRYIFTIEGDDHMLAVQGYYDGVTIKPLETLDAKPNQRVIITIMDEYVEPITTSKKRGMRGALARYANPASAKNEAGAWERFVVEKYGNA